MKAVLVPGGRGNHLKIATPQASSRLTAVAINARHSVTAILLAGGLRASPLGRKLGIPALCLPLGGGHTLLSDWLDALSKAGDCHAVRIVVSDEDDAKAIDKTLGEVNRPDLPGMDVRVTLEPARWRGTGGTIRDVVEQMERGEVVLLVEASCLPPTQLNLLLESLEGHMAMVGVGGSEPAGVYVLKREAFDLVPRVGFFDIKEQLFPALYKQGSSVGAIKLADHAIRLRTRGGYLQAVAARHYPHVEAAVRLHDRVTCKIAPSARIEGVSLIGKGAVIEEGALVRDSVVLEGVVIGRGAVVTRSVIGVDVEIGAGRFITDAIEPSRSSAWKGHERTARRLPYRHRA